MPRHIHELKPLTPAVDVNTSAHVPCKAGVAVKPKEPRITQGHCSSYQSVHTLDVMSCNQLAVKYCPASFSVHLGRVYERRYCQIVASASIHNFKRHMQRRQCRRAAEMTQMCWVHLCPQLVMHLCSSNVSHATIEQEFEGFGNQCYEAWVCDHRLAASIQTDPLEISAVSVKIFIQCAAFHCCRKIYNRRYNKPMLSTSDCAA